MSTIGLPPVSELSIMALSINWTSGVLSLEIVLASNNEVEASVRIARWLAGRCIRLYPDELLPFEKNLVSDFLTMMTQFV